MRFHEKKKINKLCVDAIPPSVCGIRVIFLTRTFSPEMSEVRIDLGKKNNKTETEWIETGWNCRSVEPCVEMNLPEKKNNIFGKKRWIYGRLGISRCVLERRMHEYGD